MARHRAGLGGVLRWLAACSLVVFTSCTAPRGPLIVTDPDPSVKIPAIEKAVREKDMSALPQLVKDLDNDDAAVRFYANHALEQLSGMNFGYRFFDDTEQREPAAKKWRQWLSEPSAGHPKAVPAATRASTGPS
jgi:hypothetical protein